MSKSLLNLFIATAFSVSFLVSGCSSKQAAETKSVEKQKPAQQDLSKVSSDDRDKEVRVKVNAKRAELVGEVIDAWCYCSKVMGDGRGKEHEKCAKLCVAGGVSAGILTDDGTVYIAAKYQGYKGANGILLPYVAKRVRVKGWIAERGGCKVIKVREVEEIKPDSEKSEESQETTAPAKNQETE